MYDEYELNELKNMVWRDNHLLPRNWSLIYYDPISRNIFTCWGFGH